MKPLEGIKVVDLTTFIAAPATSKILADQGADVIKVEPIEGEPHRKQGFLLTCPIKDDENPVYDIVNANKKVISVNLKEKQGLEIIYKLLEDADVLITNYREDALLKLKLSYEDLSAKYPRLVYGHVNGYGEKGPDSAKPGYDVVAFFGRSGFSQDTVAAGNTPLVNVGGIGDSATGIALAQGVTAALLKRERTGKGDKVSSSLYHTAIFSIAIMVTATQYKASYPVPYENPALSPVVGHPYKTKDGKWILIMLLDFRYWAPFCKSIGREDLIDNEKFNTPIAAKTNQSELVPLLAEIIGSETCDVWSERWAKDDIPFEVLRHISDVHTDEQALVNDFLRPISYPSGKTVKLPTTPIQFRGMGQPQYKIPGPAGADTKEVLQSLGYSSEQIDKMKENKVIKAK